MRPNLFIGKLGRFQLRIARGKGLIIIISCLHALICGLTQWGQSIFTKFSIVPIAHQYIQYLSMASMSKNNNSKGAAFDLAFANEDQESSRRPQKPNNVRIWALKILHCISSYVHQ